MIMCIDQVIFFAPIFVLSYKRMMAEITMNLDVFPTIQLGNLNILNPLSLQHDKTKEVKVHLCLFTGHLLQFENLCIAWVNHFAG